MTTLWPWLAVAGVGALHGLSPATGWLFAVAIGVRTGDRSQALRALLPIAAGHALSIAVVAALVALGLSMDRDSLIAVAAALVLVVAAVHVALHHRRSATHSLPRIAGGGAGVSRSDARLPARGFCRGGGRATNLPLTVYSFVISTLHGSGLMLVPALIPLCSSTTPGRELTASGSMTIALAVVAAHTAAMLLVTGAVAAGACRGLQAGSTWLNKLRRHRELCA